MKERLQKIIARWGDVSRRKAEALILSGKVRVDGVTVSKVGVTVDPENSVIEVAGKKLEAKDDFVYLVYNKPRGIITSLGDPFGRKTVKEALGSLFSKVPRIYPVGRLDRDTEGLLILTNDGALTARLLHPSNSVEREYLVTVSGFSQERLKKVMEGVEIDGRLARPAGLEILRVKTAGETSEKRGVLPVACLKVILTEGRKREVRRLFGAAWMEVIHLKRVRFGPIRLGKLKPGETRYLSASEIAELRKAAGLLKNEEN